MAGPLSKSDVMRILVAWLSLEEPGFVPDELELRGFRGGRERRILLPIDGLGSAAPPAPRPAPAPEPATRHSPDFRSCHWYGTDYHFTPLQAAVVRLLWEAWQNGTADVSQEKLIEESGSDSKRLRDIFKGHEAFGTVIAAGETRGTFRLWEP